jgi:hypothetical protein
MCFADDASIDNTSKFVIQTGVKTTSILGGNMSMLGVGIGGRTYDDTIGVVYGLQSYSNFGNNHIPQTTSDSTKQFLDFDYSGLNIGIVLWPKDKYRMLAEVFLGAMSLDVKNSAGDIVAHREYTIIEPGMNLEINPIGSDLLGLGIGLNYRFTFGETIDEVDRKELDGISIGFQIKFLSE